MRTTITILVALTLVCQVFVSGCIHFIELRPAKECEKWFLEGFSCKNEFTKDFIRKANVADIYEIYRCHSRYSYYTETCWLCVAPERANELCDYAEYVIGRTKSDIEIKNVTVMLRFLDAHGYCSPWRNDALMRKLHGALSLFSQEMLDVLMSQAYNDVAYKSDYFLQTYSFSNPACADVIRSFYRLDNAGRVERFRAMDAEERFQVLACGEEVSRSDMLFLVPKFVADTPRAELMMRDKLDASRDVGVVNAALDVLWELARQGRYDFTKDKVFVRLVLAKAEGVRKGDWPSEKSDLLQAVSKQ